jgi:hypothetical protein
MLCSVPESSRITQVWRAVLACLKPIWSTFSVPWEAASRVGRLYSFGASVEMADI